MQIGEGTQAVETILLPTHVSTIHPKYLSVLRKIIQGQYIQSQSQTMQSMASLQQRIVEKEEFFRTIKFIEDEKLEEATINVASAEKYLNELISKWKKIRKCTR